MTGPQLLVVTCNARKELRGLPVSQLAATIARLGADVILWQEVETTAHRSALTGLAGYTTVWPGGAANAVPITYRTATFKSAGRIVVRQTHKGERGITPARFIVSLVLHTWTGDAWPFINTHLISQAWTSHPERRPRWQRHARLLRRRSRVLRALHGRVVGAGDVNRSRWAPYGTGIWAPRPTHGKQFYDVLWVAGRVGTVGAARRVQTNSDHDALIVRLEAIR